MALAILSSHPETILKAENNIKSQIAALLTSVPTIFKWWSINAAVVLLDAVIMVKVKGAVVEFKIQAYILRSIGNHGFP